MLQIIHSEMRLAFKNCARTPSLASAPCRTLSTFPSPQPGHRDNAGAVSRPYSTRRGKEVTKLPGAAQPYSPASAQQNSRGSNSTNLVPQTPKAGAVERPRRSDIPARLLPKAQISPGLTLSPKERLQIEYETRRPPKAPEKPGEQGREISKGQTWRLTCRSLQRTSVDIPWWLRKNQLHSAITSLNHRYCSIWSRDNGSSLLSP